MTNEPPPERWVCHCGCRSFAIEQPTCWGCGDLMHQHPATAVGFIHLHIGRK